MTERNTIHGPYDTDSDAMRDARHVHQAYRVNYERGLMDRINEGMLLGTLREAGVELGAYDKRIAGWLADWEPHVVHVILGWIERAHAAGQSAGNLAANWAHHVAAQQKPAVVDPAEAAQDFEITHHAVMRYGIGGPACGTAPVWQPMTRDACAVTCPICLATLSEENGGA